MDLVAVVVVAAAPAPVQCLWQEWLQLPPCAVCCVPYARAGAAAPNVFHARVVDWLQHREHRGDSSGFRSHIGPMEVTAPPLGPS